MSPVTGFVFFDMDETLGFFRNFDGALDDAGFPHGIYLRANIREILQELRKSFLIIVTTAATKTYTLNMLSLAGLADLFFGIFTREDFVKLMDSGNGNGNGNTGDASPEGYEKHYSIPMRQHGISLEQARNGVIIGDNDFDISSDVSGLSTIILDSLYIPANFIRTLIEDFFRESPPSLDYTAQGIGVRKMQKRHPITHMETWVFDITYPEDLYDTRLEYIKAAVKNPSEKTGTT